MYKDNLLQDKIALVTGGRSGIGYEISKQFLQLGAKVYIASRKEEPLTKAKEELSAFGPCEAFVCDIRNTAQIQAIADGIKEKDGRLDILINNAGGQFPSLAENITENGWTAVINNNLNGTFFMTQAMAKTFFIKQKEGIVVNIIANIYRGFPGMAHTGAARAGVDNLTKSLAIEWAKHNIRVNAIAPGIIQSSGMKNYPPQLLEGISESIPMKRLGTVEEVAHLTTFLVSPMAGFITGETVYVDGGNRLAGEAFKVW
jgi:citronellol/citronellal dehydrogenase